MSKLAPVTCKEVKDLLRHLGFEKKKTNAGSHEKWKHPKFRGAGRSVTVDCPKAPFDDFLMGSMARQAGLSKQEFWEACLGIRCHTTLVPAKSGN